MRFKLHKQFALSFNLYIIGDKIYKKQDKWIIEMAQSRLNLYKLEHWSSALGEWPIFPDAVEESRRNGSFTYTEQKTNFMIVTLVLEGELQYTCMNSSYYVKKGEILIIPLNAAYSFSNSPKGYYHKLVLEIKGASLDSYCSMIQLDRPLQLKTSDFDSIESRIRELAALLHDSDEKNIPSMLAILHGLLAEFSLSVKAVQAKNIQLILKAKARLENDLSNRLDINELAASLGISVSMLNKLFRKKLSSSPMHYRIQARLKTAANLLERTSMPLKEVAMHVGYANQLYFSNDFKKHYKVSPRAYRNTKKIDMH